MFEMWMDIGGHQQEEFKMYLENPCVSAAIHPSLDVNFIKPPMVDREGVIMCPNAINMHGAPSRFQGYRTQGKYLTAALAGIANSPATTTGCNNGRTTGGYANVTAGGSATIGNYIHSWVPADAMWTGSAASANVRASTWTKCIDNTYVTWPSTIRPVPKTIMQSKIKENDSIARKYRLQDYLMYLANVKNIPIGVVGSKSMILVDGNNGGLVSGALAKETTIAGGDTTFLNWNFAKAFDAHQTYSQATTLTVALPIFSGLIGVWAEKAFPTMLIAPGSFYIQLRFAKVAQAFQLAMDPCRRVIGSFRDYVPSVGLSNGYATEYGGVFLAANKCALGTGNITAAAAGTTWLALTDNACNGTDFAWCGIINNFKVDVTDAIVGSCLAHMHPIYSSTASVIGGGVNVNQYLPAYGYGGGNVTGCPKPQYVPKATPWIYSGGWFKAADDGTITTLYTPTAAAPVYYVEETANCFGTYLPASTAQVRRTTTSYNAALVTAGATGLGSSNSPGVSITITNLLYVGQQIILPDEVTASIVKMAVDGDISLVSRSCRTYRQVLGSSPTQNLILPIKIASATAMFVLFQNATMMENTHYLSCTRNCPFSTYTWTPTNTSLATQYFVGSDVAPTITSVQNNTPFSIQLRIGNELLPIQPITNVPMLVQELQRAVHAVQDMSWTIPVQSSIRQWRSNDNKSTAATSNQVTGGSEYIAKDNDFFTPYYPIDALDDQTITDNPLYRDYPSSAAAKLNANNRGLYVANSFLPPVSKFMIGFDLETFPNQSDVARSGRYLGNGPLTLVMSGCTAPSVSSVSTLTSSDTYYAIAVVLFDIRFSIMAGGQLLSYY
jgi:hypothetical protein